LDFSLIRFTDKSVGIIVAMDENTKELSKKLGINVNNVLYTLHAPDNYLQALAVPTSIEEIKDMDGSIDWIQTFNKDIQATRDETTVIKSKLVQSGQLWICWPKKSSRVSTNLTDKTVWQIGLVTD
jgi:hypothetical protein